MEINNTSEKTTVYHPEREIPNGWVDLRNIIHPKKNWAINDPTFIPESYYQVFDRKFGFQPNLSIQIGRASCRERV